MTNSRRDRLLRATFGDRLPADGREPFPFSSLVAGTPLAADGEEPNDRLIDAAAVTGYFDPTSLARSTGAGTSLAGLSALATDCDLAIGPGGSPAWILRSGPRRERLALLSADRVRLDAVLARVRSKARDGAGKYLGQLLTTGQLPPEPETSKQLRDLLQALDWSAEILPFEKEILELRRQLASRSMRESLSGLLRDGFFGRAKETARLARFLAANSRRKRSETEKRLRVLTISGIGGAGKSTFVARAVTRLLADDSGPLAIAIDFDRFCFGPNSLLELSFELTRQLSVQIPSLFEPCQQLRREIRAQALDARGDDSEFDSSGASSLGENLWRRCVERLGELMSAQGPARRRIALFLDTFELAQAVRVWGSPWSSGREASSKIGSWLGALAEWGGLNDLAVVISGRAAVEPDSLLGRNIVASIELSELELGARIQLLRRLKTPPALANELARTLGGNPLMLRLGARLLARLDGEASATVLADLRRAGTLAEEFIQGFLYERVLRHVTDPRARNLAHPGLALRLVTWRLIKEVLAQPCGLGPITDRDAQDLLAALGDEIWLVERRSGKSGATILEHRRDIRVLMLRMMPFDLGRTTAEAGPALGNSSLEGTWQEIHRRAAAYHELGQDPDLDPEVAAQEAAYHRLMRVEGDLVPADIALAGRNLGDDLAALPLVKRIRVKVELGEVLTPTEIEAAPSEDWLIYSLREGRARLFAQDDPEAALQLVEQRRPRHPNELPSWYLKALDAAVRWEDVPGGELDALQAWLGRPDGTVEEYAGLERVALSSPTDGGTHRMLAEDLAERSAALFQLRFKRSEFEQARRVAEDFLRNQGLSSRLLRRDKTQWVNLIHAWNDYRVGEAAAGSHGRGSDAFQGQLEREILQRSEGLGRHDSNFNAELQRYVFINFHRSRELPRIWATPRTFVPDPSWLEEIVVLASSGTAGDRLAYDLRQLRIRIEAKAERGELTSSELASAAAEFADIFERNRSPLLGAAQADRLDPRLLRGDDREFRPAAKFALRTAFPEAGDLRLLAELGQRFFRWNPCDLSPELLAKEVPKVGVARLVDYADSAQVLSPLLGAAQKLRPEVESLARVAAASSRWEAALMKAMTF